MNTSSGQGNNGNQSQQRKTNQNIQVYVRVRPLNARERCIRSAEVIDVVSPREIVTRHSLDSKLTKKFTFDRTFGPDSRQVDVYSVVVAPLIDEVLSGYNCTVFAYGQTGTGKTHTMVGNECAELKSSWEDDSEIGIIPRALSHLFDELRLMELEFSMRISYLELYNEELCDLLSSEDSTKIRIFDDSTKKGSVIIQGLEEIPVHSKDDVYKLLEKGKERRKTATTLMNAQSSRSHTVFSILVHIRENGIDGEEMLKIGKLNLVDLAGSENVSKAGNEKGIRVRETVNINQSLLTLGRVITALVERTPHIPYRESKLTRLLQESLGGRTKTSIIATISPGHKDIEETLSTLEYAHRAKNIQNKPEVNQKLTKKTVLKEYTEEIDKLKRDLMAARDKNGIYLAEETYLEMTLKMDSQNRELNEKMLLLKALKDELQNKERIFNEVSLNLVEKTEELKRTEQNLNQTKGALQQTKKILNTTKRRYQEKKVLLESHVKTEQELTNQAAQILQVADIATQDTQALHNTIERRKDVDRKIESACERFSNRMHDNFELMNGNLDNLHKQRESLAQDINDELSNSINVQSQLLRDADEKIRRLNELCEKSQASTYELTEQFTKATIDLSSEHKRSLQLMFEELKSRELLFKMQIQEDLADLATYNDEQKSAIDTMRDSIVQVLTDNTRSLEEHTCQVQQRLEILKQSTQHNVAELKQISGNIAQERSLIEQEEALINEFQVKMQALQQQRSACADNIATTVASLEQNSKVALERLDEEVTSAQDYCIKTRTANGVASDRVVEQTVAAALCVDKSTAKCSSLRVQLESLCEESDKRLNGFGADEAAYCQLTEQRSTEHVTQVKRMRLENVDTLRTASDNIKKSLEEGDQRVKNHIAVAIGLSSAMQNTINDFSRLYKDQMGTCIKDVETFRRSELKTYSATGSTPSKRDFTYPRVLVATSPHTRIVKRYRQENDWSDIDTTLTIDEESENDPEENTIQGLSHRETLLNSTPINESLEGLSVQRISGNSSHNSCAAKTPQSSLSRNNSPRKLASCHNSLVYLNENKENVS